MNNSKIKANSYGEVLSLINELELVSEEYDGGYQGEFMVVLTDGIKLFYYFDSYGSCSGCDWLEDVRNYKSEIEYKEALDFCGGIKPKYIVPKDSPLEFTSKEYEGFSLKAKKQ